MNFANTGQGLFRFGGAGNSQRRKRPIIIDGQNVAVEHGKERSRGKLFSARGIEIVVEYFKLRGHGGEGEEIVAWLPRKLQGNIDFPDNKRIMDKLEDERHIKYTMDRSLQDGRRLKSYDDRYVLLIQDILCYILCLCIFDQFQMVGIDSTVLNDLCMHYLIFINRISF